MQRRRTLRDDLHDEIVERIMTGILPPGDLISESDLGDEFGVSRTPVREAILQLGNENFVVTDPNRWTRVAELDYDTIRCWYETIAMLEALAAELAAGNLTDDQLQELRQINTKMSAAIEANDATEARRLDDAFHRIIAAAAQRPHLESLIEQHRKKLRWADVVFFAEGDLRRQAVPEHQEIMHALERGNRATAGRLTRKNWERGIEHLSVNRPNA